MPAQPAMREAAAGGVRDAITDITLHSADPGATGASEISRITEAGIYTSNGTGTLDLTADKVFAIDAGEAPAYWGTWAGATWLGGESLTAAEGSYGSAGTYTLTSAPIPVS